MITLIVYHIVNIAQFKELITRLFKGNDIELLVCVCNSVA